MSAAGDIDRVHDRTLQLPDGRNLGFRIYGDPDGQAVLFLHGTPGSRLKFALAHASGQRLGLAIVAPDRWGYGLTQAPARPSLHAFADDMTVLMDGLGRARFGVGGISGGGPYAAAVAACLPERVTALALVSPVGPITDAGLAPSLPFLHRLCFTVLPRRPRTVATVMRAFRWSLTHTPRLSGHLTTWRAAHPDKQLIRRADVRHGIISSFREGLRTGTGGPGLDLSMFSQAWNIDLAQVSAPARLWIGARDSNVPVTAAKALAQRIPRCVLTEMPDAGHLWVSVHHAEVLAWVAAAARKMPAVEPRP